MVDIFKKKVSHFFQQYKIFLNEFIRLPYEVSKVLLLALSDYYKFVSHIKIFCNLLS